MAISVETITMAEARQRQPRPDSIATYHPSIEPGLQTYPGLRESFRELGGNRLVAAFGYGSSFNGESSESMIDVIILVDDSAAFHRENRTRRPEDYVSGFVGGWRVQTALNRQSANYYHTELLIGDELKGAKYGVIGYEDFLAQAGAGLRGTGNPAHLYTSGRLHKAAIYPFIKAEPEKQEKIDTAINQARIDGIWLALGQLPEQFDLSTMLHTYVSVSYAADLRMEKPNKIDLLISQSENDYGTMMKDLLGAFKDQNIIEEIDENQFRKVVSLTSRDVNLWLMESALYSGYINYIKTFLLTVGLGKGWEYGWAKGSRATGINCDWVPGRKHATKKVGKLIAKAPEDVDLDTLAADISAILEGRKRKDS